MKPKILVVEDSLEQIVVVKATLKHAYDLEICQTLAEAHLSLQGSRPDLLLLDAGLPDGNGYEFCEELNRDPLKAKIPVIFLTGRTATKEKIQAFNAGAYDFISKPCQPSELLSRVNAHFRRVGESL